MNYYYQKKARLDALFKLPCPALQSVAQRWLCTEERASSFMFENLNLWECRAYKEQDLIVSSTVPVKRPDWEVQDSADAFWPVWQVLLTELSFAIICVSALHPLHFEQGMTFTGQAGGGVLLLAGKQLFLAAASANAQKTELAKEVLSPWILQRTIWSLNYWQLFIIYLVQPLNSTFRKQQQPKLICSPFQDYSF